MTTFPGDPNDVLTRLTGALAAQPIPTGPDASLKQDLIATLERQSKRSIAPRDRNLRSGWTMQRVLKIAAAFLMIVGVSGFVMTRSSGSGSVFAAMIDRVNEIRTARFNMRSNMKLDDGPTTIDSTITLASPWTRVDANMDGLKATKITNSEQHKTLMLFEHSKTAKLSDNTGAPQKLQQNDVVARLRSLPKVNLRAGWFHPTCYENSGRLDEPRDYLLLSGVRWQAATNLKFLSKATHKNHAFI